MAEKHRSNAVLTLIGLFKLVKVVALLVGGIAALSLVHRDLAHGVKGWIDQLQPEHKIMQQAVGKLSDMSPRELRVIGIGMLAYAVVFAIEGVGLLMRKLWAEYLTTIITASFIPLEIYEAAEKGSWLKVAVIVANFAIVGYLVWRIRSEHHWPFRRRAASAKPAFA